MPGSSVQAPFLLRKLSLEVKYVSKVSPYGREVRYHSAQAVW